MVKHLAISTYNIGQKIILNANHSSWENDRFSFYWEGIVFIKGIKAEIDSLKRFSQMLEIESIERACSYLSGVFFLVVHDKDSDDYYCFVDNSGLFRAFYSDTYVSTSFLELVSACGCTKRELDEEAIVEFLHMGLIYFDRTFFSSIKKIKEDQIVHISRAGKMRILHKHVINVFEPVLQDSKEYDTLMIDTMEDICHSLKDLKISMDLTGGTDTRLLTLLFDYFGLEFEVSTSGVEGISDITVARKVASALSHPHYITYHSADFSDDLLDKIFEVTDAQLDILNYHRLFKYQQDRLDRGVELIISGAGGELYKDTFWLQDFPFYNKKKINIDRLINLRLVTFKPEHSLLSDKLKEISKELTKRLREKLQIFILETNTRTYDNIWYNYFGRENAGGMLTSHSKFTKSYAPLLDPHIVRIGVNLPRVDRLFNNFYRRIITKLNPDIACIPTTENGMSISSETDMILKDLAKYVSDICLRAIRHVGKRITRKMIFLERADNPDLIDRIKSSKIMQVSVECLKDRGVLAEGVSVSDISRDYASPVITLAKLIEKLK